MKVLSVFIILSCVLSVYSRLMHDHVERHMACISHDKYYCKYVKDCIPFDQNCVLIPLWSALGFFP